MEQKYILGSIALAMVAVLGISMVSAFGGLGFMNAGLSDEEKAEIQENKEAMKEVIENADYDAWVSLMNEKIAKMQAQITEENFNKIVEKHSNIFAFKEAVKEAKESGEFDRAKMQELREEFGIEDMPGKGRGNGFKKGFGRGLGNCPFAES